MNSAGKDLVAELKKQVLLLGLIMMTYAFWCANKDIEIERWIVCLIGGIMIILEICAIKVKEEMEKEE